MIAVLGPALILIALRSAVGFIRRHIRRELWRRGVAAPTHTTGHDS